MTNHDFITLGKNAIDLTNCIFHKLTVIGPIGRSSDRKILWLCRCDCGNLVSVRSKSLINKETRSCGCLRSTSAIKTHTSHGMSHDLLYGIWKSMIRRCTIPQCNNYPDYGGRGISVCSEWFMDIHAFISYVSSLSFFGMSGRTLDRINNDGNYEPGNVRWATAKEQARNTRRNRILTFNGATKSVVSWSEELEIPVGRLYYRLFSGWTVERTLTTSVDLSKVRHKR